jgi:hypothetical protein
MLFIRVGTSSHGPKRITHVMMVLATVLLVVLELEHNQTITRHVYSCFGWNIALDALEPRSKLMEFGCLFLL